VLCCTPQRSLNDVVMMLRLLQVLAMPGIGSLTREVIARDIKPGCACGYGECRA
jgi:hypothetical protein